jgi:prepilin-type N-terminal cleavage/methylation domain-containing protein
MRISVVLTLLVRSRISFLMLPANLHTRRGFTLIELMFVILLIAMIASVSVPRLLPLITLTEHQNEARHLVGFGRASMAHASMAHENIVVRIDLDNQRYWVEMQPDVYEEPEGIEDDPYAEDDDWMPEDKSELRAASQTILMGNDVEQEFSDGDDQTKILERQRENMGKEFSSMTLNSLFARAKRVRHEDDDLFGRDELVEDDLYEDEYDGEPGTNPVDNDLLMPHVVIESVFIDSVYVGEEEYTKGIVDIELSPLGLETGVAMVLINEDSDVLVVQWDPLTGNAWFGEMKESS